MPENFPGSLTDTENKTRKKTKNKKKPNNQRSGQCPETARTDGQTYNFNI